MNNSNTKKSLKASGLALFVCIAMLIGTTFAWFTDSITNSGNKIESGSLDITFEEWNGTEYVDASKEPIFNYNKWEPGYTDIAAVKIANEGTLALKYQIDFISEEATENSEKLAEAIEVYYKDDANAEDGMPKDLTGFDKIGTLADFLDNKDNAATGTLKANGNADYAMVALHMPESAGNDVQNLSTGAFDIVVSATQLNSEEDGFGNPDYDKDAPMIYPDGVTEESFGDKNIAYANGEYYETFTDALKAINENNGGSLYFKKDAVVDFNTHLAVTADLTLYANGADFKGRDISIGTYGEPTEDETTISIYDAKNLTVWGQPSNRGDVWNVNMTNCDNDGAGLLMYRGGMNKDKINFTATNCKVNGVMDALHTTASGTVTVKNSTFSNIDAGVNIAYKQMGTMDVTVENSTFISCGKVDTANDYFAPVRFVKNGFGKLTVSLKNNTFKDTIGTNGDILLGDYRDGKVSLGFTTVIETEVPVMVKSSEEPAYSFNGGTIEL